MPGNCASRPKSSGCCLSFAFVARDEGHGRSRVAAGQRDAGVAGDCRGGGDAGHDFVLDVRGPQAPTSSTRWPNRPGSPPFSRTTVAAGRGQLDQPAIDFVLAPDLVATVPAQADQLGGLGSHGQDSRIDQIVVKHDFGARQALGTAQRQPGRDRRVRRRRCRLCWLGDRACDVVPGGAGKRIVSSVLRLKWPSGSS